MGLFLGKLDIPIIDKGWVGFEAVLFDIAQEFAPLFAGASEGEPASTGEACGAVDYRGTCDDGVVSYCANGELRKKDCAGNGLGCDWIDDTTGNWCVAGCGDLDYQGACDGSSVRWCDGGRVATYECADAGKTCGWQDDIVGYNCH
jgi:hypothetical protein